MIKMYIIVYYSISSFPWFLCWSWMWANVIICHYQVRTNLEKYTINLCTAPNPWGPWSAPHEVVDCTDTFCYGSYMHPNHVIPNPDGTYSVYFVSSSMFLPGTSGLWDCQKHLNNNDVPIDNPHKSVKTSDPNFQCNWVYNTFLVRMDFRL